MEHAFEDEALTSGEAGQDSPLDAEAPKLDDRKVALINELEPMILKLAPQPIPGLTSYTCPFCRADFGSCTHSQGVPPIQETSAP